MILTIKSVTDKGDKISTQVNGKWYSAFKEINKQPNPALTFLRAGVTADFDVRDSADGKFHNIVDARALTAQQTTTQAAPAAQQRPQTEQGGYADAEIIKRASIEAQTSYNGIIALAVAGKCPPETLTMALNWAKMRLCAPVTGDEDI